MMKREQLALTKAIESGDTDLGKLSTVLLLFILNSCSLIGREHVTCKPVNIDIVLKQLILC